MDSVTLGQCSVQVEASHGEYILHTGEECVRGQSWMDTVAIVLRWLSNFLSLTRCWGQTDDLQSLSVFVCVQALLHMGI